MDPRPLPVTCACGRAFEAVAGKNVSCPSCGKPVAALPPKDKPTVRRSTAAASSDAVPPSPIPGYTFLKRLGAGGMGEVFLARQVSLDRLVAVKLLPPDLAQDRAYVENFVKEARSAGKLSHENITGAVDVGDAGGRYYFVMEYVGGDTLFALIKKEGPLPEAKALGLIRQAARGLRHAHQQGFVHRDVKPKNLLVTEDGVVKICDFGLARALKADATEEEGILHVTPSYASPEQCRADKSLDHRTDIYSLGVTLFETLTGKRPFTGATSRDILKKHLSEEPPSPRVHAPGTSEATSALVLRMLRKNPEERFKTYDELLAAIDAAAVPAKTAASPARAKNRKVLALAGAGVAAVLLIAVASLFMGGKPKELPPAVDPQVEAALKEVRDLQRAVEGRPADYAAARAKWQEFEARFRGTPSHPQFSTGLREFEARVLAEAERVATELAADADLSLRAGKHLAALESLRRYPAAFSKLEPGIRIGTKMLEAERALGGKVNEDLKACRELSAAGKFDDARGRLHLLRLAVTARGEDGREEILAAYRPQIDEAQKAVDADQALALQRAKPGSQEPPAPALVPAVRTPDPAPAVKPTPVPVTAPALKPKRSAAVPHVAILRDVDLRLNALQRAEALKAFEARAGRQSFSRAAQLFLERPEASWKLDGPAGEALAEYLGSPALDVPADITPDQHAALFALLAEKIGALGGGGAIEALQLFACAHAAEITTRKGRVDPAVALQARFGKGAMSDLWGPSASVGRIEAAGLLAKAPGPWIARAGEAALAAPDLETRALGLLFTLKEPLLDVALTVDKWKKFGAAAGDPAWQKTCDGVAERLRAASTCEPCAGQGRHPCGGCAGGGVAVCGACRGSGKVIDPDEGTRITCTACRGRMAVLCTVCNGAKTLKCATCDTKKTRPLLPGGLFRMIVDLALCDSCRGQGTLLPGAAWPCGSCTGFGRRVAEIPRDFGRLPPWTKAREGRSAWNALRWLARHQAPDGSWGATSWNTQCREPGCLPFPAAAVDLALTSLTLLSFLGAGFEPASEVAIGGEAAGGVVRRTLAWLLARQNADGQFTASPTSIKPVFEHLVTLTALATALQAVPVSGAFPDGERLLLRDGVLRGLRWALMHQTKGGGWGYTTAAPSDSWVTSWGATALVAARDAGMDVPKMNLAWILQWYDSVTDKADLHIGYSPTMMGKVNLTGNENFLHHDTLSAYGSLLRLWIDGRATAALPAAERNVERDLPNGDPLRRDYAYWYVGTFFMAHRDQRKGAAWDRWTQALLRETLLLQESADTCALGSLPPTDRWSAHGGKAYAAAITALALEYAGGIRPLSFSSKK